jgi:hypothetical protein
MRNLDRSPGADVVGTSRRALLEDQPICPHRIANVGQVAERFEIADLDFRPHPPRLDQRNRSREAGADKRWILPRTKVIERPRQIHKGSIGISGAHHLLGQLAQPVRAGRDERIVLALRGRRRGVHERRAGVQHVRIRRERSQRLDQVMRPEDIAGQRGRGSVPRLTDVRRPGAVIDESWLHCLDRVADRLPIEQVDRLPAHRCAVR